VARGARLDGREGKMMENKSPRLAASPSPGDGHEDEMMENENKSLLFGQRLRTARQKAGLTQTELGNRSGLVKHAAVRISRFECGKHVPTIDFAGKMAAVLKVPSFYFYCEDEALAMMFLRLADCLGDDWKRFLLVQMQEVLAQQQAVALPGKRNADSNTGGSWPDAERRTGVDRRSGQQGAGKSQDNARKP
jgi:transcriptional regulator with XRE-family HTH domain